MTQNSGTESYPHIFRPLDIGTTRVRHRIMVTGHTQLYGEHGTLSERHLAYYAERARGGAALLILEQQAAHPAGRNYHAGCEAWDPRVIPWYERLGEAVHAHDCRQFVQLFASGAQGSGTQYIDDWRPLWAASRIPSAVTEEMPVAMEQTHIDDLVAHFARSAGNVKRAGLDGVEIHAAHSQLLGEFLSPAFNKRSDQYGGDEAARCRLVLEVGEAIRAATGDGFTLGLRLSFDEFLGEAGITPEQSEIQLDILARSGLFDFFDISGGGYHALHVAVAPMGSMPEAFLGESAGRAKAVVGEKARVFVVGRVLDLDTAEHLLETGDADMVAMTRAHMADAEVVNKSIRGQSKAIHRCVGANVCVQRLIDNREVTCFQNPAMGREARWGAGTLTRAKTPSRIAVIGAGPAGLRFAGTAASRGHSVDVFDSADAPGGRLRLLAELPTRGGWHTAIENLVNHAELGGARIRTGHPVDSAPADAEIVVLATGARWNRNGLSPYRPERDSIPGHEQDFVLDVETAISAALDDPTRLGKRVLIIDETGEYLPLGLAEMLAEAGAGVELLTPRPFVGSETQRTLDMPWVMPRLKKLGVITTAQHFVERIDQDAVRVYDIWGGDPQVRLNIDTVVIAMTREPRDALFGALNGSATVVHRIGDVVAPRRIEAVIYDGEKLAREI